MDEIQETSSPAKPAVLTKEQRSEIAKAAATRRWDKARKAKLRENRLLAKSKGSKGGKAGKKPAGPREFTSALKTAEKQLAKALHDRDEAATRYALANAQIPSLMRIITALKPPGKGEQGLSGGIGDAPTLEQIVSGQSFSYQNPPRAVAVVPVPQTLHPANQQGRAMGGAVGVELAEDENENQFLETSGVAGGEWH